MLDSEFSLANRRHSVNALFRTCCFCWQIQRKLVNFHTLISGSAAPVECFRSHRDCSVKIGGRILAEVKDCAMSLWFSWLRARVYWGYWSWRWVIQGLEAHGSTRRLHLATAARLAPKRLEHLPLVESESSPRCAFPPSLQTSGTDPDLPAEFTMKWTPFAWNLLGRIHNSFLGLQRRLQAEMCCTGYYWLLKHC